MSDQPRRRLVVGDIHGMWRALKQVLERAGFDPEQDELISLGDLVDRGPESKEVLKFLAALRWFRWVRGNHDDWAYNWLKFGVVDYSWWSQGGEQTVLSLNGSADMQPSADVRNRWLPFFNRAERYIEVDGCLLLHAGYDPSVPLLGQSESDLMWSRILVRQLINDEEATPDAEPVSDYRRIFVGHTPVFLVDGSPVRRREVWMLDQGAAYGGPLTVMDLETEEWWQSDRTATLYNLNS